MTGTIAQALARLKAAYPSQPFGDRAVLVYAEQLADMDDGAVYEAVGRLLNTSVRMPTIAEIRREVVERELGLPTPDEAWDMALSGSSGGIPEVAGAIKAVGGPWLIRHSTNTETLRAQFLRTYENRRAATIRDAAAGAPITGSQLRRIQEATTAPSEPTAKLNGHPVDPVSLNARRVAQIPETTRIRPRPLTIRMSQRYAGRVLPEPDEETIHDAIRILEAGPVMDDDPLYREAESVMAHVSRMANVPR